MRYNSEPTLTRYPRSKTEKNEGIPNSQFIKARFEIVKSELLMRCRKIHTNPPTNAAFALADAYKGMPKIKTPQ